MGAVAIGLYLVVFGFLLHKLILSTEFNRKIYARMTLIQYIILQSLLLIMVALPVKIILRLVFRIKNVWVTPWFNV